MGSESGGKALRGAGAVESSANWQPKSSRPNATRSPAAMASAYCWAAAITGEVLAAAGVRFWEGAAAWAIPATCPNGGTHHRSSTRRTSAVRMIRKADTRMSRTLARSEEGPKEPPSERTAPDREGLVGPQVVGDIGDDHAEFEEQRGLDQQGALIVQQVLPPARGHDLPQHNCDPRTWILLPDLLDIVEQWLEKRP